MFAFIRVRSRGGDPFARVAEINSRVVVLDMLHPPVGGEMIGLGFVQWRDPVVELAQDDNRIRIVEDYEMPNLLLRGVVVSLRRQPAGSFLVEVDLVDFVDKGTTYPLATMDPSQGSRA